MKYRREIDGLRALAVIPVILFHAGFQVFSGGYVGVDIFFVISGYLITTIIRDEIAKGEFSIINFYEHRVRRIMPALFFVMLCALPFAWVWMLPQDMKMFSESLVAVPLFSTNILFYLTSGGYFDGSSELRPLLHTWSLSVEEQFYALFPIFLIMTRKLEAKWIFIQLFITAIISIIAAQWGVAMYPSFAFYFLPTRAFEILIGSLISLCVNRNPSSFSKNIQFSQSFSFLGLILILFAIFTFDSKTPSPGLYSLIPTTGAGLVLLFAHSNNLTGKLLGSKYFVAIGLISYSAYLWHQPLFAFARLRCIEHPSNFLFGILSILSLLLGYFSWKYVEKPFRNKQLISRGRVFFYCISGSLFFIVIGLAGYLLKGIPSRMPSESNPYLYAINDKNPRQIECHFTTDNFPKPSDSCVLGRKDNIQGVLLGDSHADAISFELEKNLELNNLGFLSLTFSGCPPVKNVHRADIPLINTCYKFNEQLFKFLIESPEIHYVVLSARWTIYLEKKRFNNGEGGVEDGGDAFLDVVNKGNKELNDEATRRILVIQNYKKTINDLLVAGKKVILVYPIPEVGWDVPITQIKRLLFNGEFSPLTTSYSSFKLRNEAAMLAFDSIPNDDNLIRIRPDKIFCNTYIIGRCITESSSNVYYYDDDHLSNEGAKLVVKEIMNFIK